MIKLNLPNYNFRLKNSENKTYIFGLIRKRFLLLTPEEWVRQHFINYLLVDKKYPISLVAVEKQLIINNLKKRTDILVFNTDGNHEIIVECKAPSVQITQETFDQIARYNLELNAKYLIVTNGLQHFYCQMDFINKTYIFLKEIPNYN